MERGENRVEAHRGPPVVHDPRELPGPLPEHVRVAALVVGHVQIPPKGDEGGPDQHHANRRQRGGVRGAPATRLRLPHARQGRRGAAKKPKVVRGLNAPSKYLSGVGDGTPEGEDARGEGVDAADAQRAPRERGRERGGPRGVGGRRVGAAPESRLGGHLTPGAELARGAGAGVSAEVHFGVAAPPNPQLGAPFDPTRGPALGPGGQLRRLLLSGLLEGGGVARPAAPGQGLVPRRVHRVDGAQDVGRRVRVDPARQRHRRGGGGRRGGGTIPRFFPQGRERVAPVARRRQDPARGTEQGVGAAERAGDRERAGVRPFLALRGPLRGRAQEARLRPPEGPAVAPEAEVKPSEGLAVAEEQQPALAHARVQLRRGDPWPVETFGRAELGDAATAASTHVN
mmetsp:Transcript_61319/g.138807  ORF Transcript_61319/g.138807 Transcript_61319/m.138807 type:complete len:399 (+) Transcript_61319:188-1384(+)